MHRFLRPPASTLHPYLARRMYGWGCRAGDHQSSVHVDSVSVEQVTTRRTRRVRVPGPADQ
eukprot:scaffold2019_cov316-Prasinococcus_capsulatus_cf.AAC.3